ncbi:MAG: RAMP superfamily CRISPR-associated protein [Campylobacteraceae bacterium]|nr:RAMP superfamily CRISPR-associated protein [Campylobacteraceae bacterium]
MRLKYKLEFYDYWHHSSGLSGGAALDSYVVKDSDGLPYVAGKTIKGLVREMAEIVGECAFINRCFGGSSDDKDRCYDKEQKNKEGICHFTNADIKDDEKDEIVSNSLQSYLYDVIASTKIEDGIAVDDSLREIEVVKPISLYGEILDVEEKDMENLKNALKMVKRLGLNRTRGLGRCEFKDFEVGEEK